MEESSRHGKSRNGVSVAELYCYPQSSHQQYPSAELTPMKLVAPKKLSPEMQAREIAAQEEIERKKKRVAPLWNKGGLQYITDDTDITTLGRKV